MSNKDRYNNRHHQPINNTTDEVIEELREEDPFETVKSKENDTETIVETTSDEPITISVEQKNEEAVISGYIETVVEEDDNQKKIEQLKKDIEKYQKEIERNNNNTINVFYHDKIMEARKEITRLSSILPPIITEEAKAPTVSDRVMHRKRLQQENMNENVIRIF